MADTWSRLPGLNIGTCSYSKHLAILKRANSSPKVWSCPDWPIHWYLPIDFICFVSNSQFFFHLPVFCSYLLLLIIRRSRGSCCLLIFRNKSSSSGLQTFSSKSALFTCSPLALTSFQYHIYIPLQALCFEAHSSPNTRRACWDHLLLCLCFFLNPAHPCCFEPWAHLNP